MKKLVEMFDEELLGKVLCEDSQRAYFIFYEMKSKLDDLNNTLYRLVDECRKNPTL